MLFRVPHASPTHLNVMLPPPLRAPFSSYFVCPLLPFCFCFSLSLSNSSTFLSFFSIFSLLHTRWRTWHFSLRFPPVVFRLKIFYSTVRCIRGRFVFPTHQIYYVLHVPRRFRPSYALLALIFHSFLSSTPFAIFFFSSSFFSSIRYLP